MLPVTVNERDALSYYPYVQGGPVEGGHLAIEGVDLVVYVNSRYAAFEPGLLNERASALFEMAGVGMWGGEVRGDALMVLSAGDGDYERSMPSDLVQIFIAADGSS
jgi:hypothetical protein